MELLATAALGVSAGLAVAVPLGPMALLILDRGVVQGRSVALAAAAGVGTVDLVYALLAVFAAAAVTEPIQDIRGPASLIGGLVLAAIAVRGLRAVAGTSEQISAQPRSASPVRTYAVFIGLTLINPTTVLTFVALAVGLSDRLADTTSRLVFVASVGAGSLVWQVGLAFVGSALGSVPRPGVRRATRLLGALALLVLAGLLVAEGLRHGL